MPKRMIDTDLWNDDDIIADFTAEDKYFWLYLLTNPHNNICGVLKYSPALMARDMGLHKDTIINLLYRFEKVHNRLYVDRETSEILILNWSKYNWTKSEDFLKTIEKKLVEVKSNYIKELLICKINEKLGKTVLTPSQEGTNTITNITPNSSSKNDYDLFVDTYNTQCFNLSSVYKTTDKRKKAIANFLKQLTFEDFENACIKANNNPFLTGKNDRGWKADFDFIIKPDNAAKIIEGSYERETPLTGMEKWMMELQGYKNGG
jgi:hypothetical protein